MIQVDGLTLAYHGEPLFEDASFSLQPRERCALVGRNGSGKSSLFRLIMGKETPDKGTIAKRKNYSIGILDQHIVFTRPTLIEEAALGLHPEEKDTVLEMLVKQEVRAEFPGGKNGWINYLSSNLQYPSQLKDSGISGQVILRFTITPKGKIEDIIVVKSLHPLIDKEANRVIAESPRWKPAEQLGKKVKTTITQPINF